MTSDHEPFPYVSLRVPIPVEQTCEPMYQDRPPVHLSMDPRALDNISLQADALARTLATINMLPDQCPWLFEHLKGYQVLLDPATFQWASMTHFADGLTVMQAVLRRAPGLAVCIDRRHPSERVFDEVCALRHRVGELTEALTKRREVDAIRKLEIEELKAEVDRLKDSAIADRVAAIADRVAARCREEGV